MFREFLGKSLILFLLMCTTWIAAGDAGTLRLKGESLEISPRATGAAIPIDAERNGDGEDGLWILHFDAELSLHARRAVNETGALILGYLPENSYLLRADRAVRQKLVSLDGVVGLLPYRPEWRLSPRLAVAAQEREILRLVLSFAPGVERREIEARLVGLGAALLQWSAARARPRLWVEAEAIVLEELARLPGLLWAEPDLFLSDRNDATAWVVQSGISEKMSIWDQGLHGEGQILGHIDSGFRWNNWDESCWFADPEDDPVGPDHRKVVFLGSYPGSAFPSHGFHTAGTLVGNGYTATAGADTTLRALAYEARMAGSSYPNLGYDLYQDLVNHADAGARVHSNSWGNDDVTHYTTLSRDIDSFSWEYEDNIVLFAVTNGPSLRTPENAKSVLAVGATYASDFNAHYSGGSGPTADGRRKPEIYAPGFAVRSAQINNPCGSATSSGTSMACPAVAGAAALARQYFVEGWYPGGQADPEASFVPSGALLRATLINGAVDMTGVSGYPSDREGWGRLILDRSLYFREESGALWLADVPRSAGLETGQVRTYHFEVLSSSRALEITMAFTDYPGELAAEFPVVNDIDLILSGPGGSYLGNVFNAAAGQSITGGAADPLNSVERIRLDQPPPGDYELSVRAAAVALGPQGFAVIASGDLLAGDEPPPPPSYQLRLDPGYPNPFPTVSNPGGVNLSYELAAAQAVTLRVYSVSGRLVRVLIDGERREAGPGQEQWDGRDEAGQPAANGVYFARLETQGGELRTTRLVHLRR